MTDPRPTNDEMADVLDQIADLLGVQEANRFRIQAYREAAQTLRTTDKTIATLVDEGGQEALEALPDIGEGIASILVAYVHTGRSELLERLQSEVEPAELFEQVPGIGEELARRVAEELDVTTLEELEQAAHDGRLEKVEGFGPTKARNVRVGLAGMLSTAAQRRRRRSSGEAPPQEHPSVALLLDVDATYRHKAEAGELRKIAPKRFNPQGEAWLPILNTQRKGWSFTALYSNTARAHELNKTHDWVVIYYVRDGEEDQATVVTETQGPLQGKRVVRGREAECQRYYERQT